MSVQEGKKVKPCDVTIDGWSCDNLARNYNNQCYPHRYQMGRYGEYRIYQRGKRSSAEVLERDELGRKHCPRCDLWLDESGYYSCKHTSDRLQPHCKDCYIWGNILRRFQLGPDRYYEILEQQGGVCAICRRTPSNERRLAVDHDHSCCPDKGPTCGQCTRGLLCLQCNAALGMIQDSEGTLLRMVDYLRKWRDTSENPFLGY